MKLLVATNGPFQLMDGSTFIRHEGASVVENSPFLQERSANVTILGQLDDGATDEGWLAYHKECDGDMDLAVDSFLSEFGIDQRPAKEKGKAKTKAKEKADAEAKEAEAEAEAAAEAGGGQ